jgi:hypothetical protein
MASITSWTRLEPHSQTDDLSVGLAARTHDPLWLLARQWQIGEFTAEDAGSPVQARLRVEHAPLTRYRPGPPGSPAGPPVAYDPAVLPLEALVEREPVLAHPAARPDVRLAAVAGAQFLRNLEAEGVGRYRHVYTARHPLTVPPDDGRLDATSRRFVTVMAGAVPDGVGLRAELRSTLTAVGGALPAEPAVAAADQAAVTRAARSWLGWFASHISEPADSSTAWQSSRLEYEFAVAAPAPNGEITLVAPEYAEGRLDWYALERHAGAPLGAEADRSRMRTVTRTVIPTPVTFRGMPAARWWELEEAEVDLGSVQAGPTDLLRLLLVGFAVEFGNDWFVVPVELEVGAVCRVRSLVVTDTFGQRTLIRPYAQIDAPRRDWRLFCLHGAPAATGTADDTAELLVLCPSLAGALHSEPVEEVLFLRDEMANVAWAVERTVASATGAPLDRAEAAPPPPPPPPVPADGGERSGLRYRLSTTVPEHWLPLVPVRVEASRPDVRLRRGRVLLDRDGQPVTPAPLGRILEPDRPLELFEEEVPRTGTRISRTYQHTRWSDGSAVAWVGRRKQPGTGEGWSGLRFDVIEPA